MFEQRLKKSIKLMVYGLLVAVTSILVVFGFQNKHTVSAGSILGTKVYADAPPPPPPGDGPGGDNGDDDSGDGGDNDDGDDDDG